MCKRSTRIWSILLVIIMIVNMLPVHALATETDSKTVDKIVADDTVSLEDLHVVEEIVDRRTEYTKEFRLNNGFRVASVYAYPVHYEEDGAWKEIDNTLTLTSTDSGNTYTNTAGIWDVSFPQSMTKNSPVSVTKDGHTLSFRLTGEMHNAGRDLEMKDSEVIELPAVPEDPVLEVQGDNVPAEEAQIAMAAPAEAVAASPESLDIRSIKDAEQYPEMVAEKLGSRLRYANVYANTDVVFDMTSNTVKESVVLKEYDESLLGYTYTLDTGEMIPVLQEDGGIELLDPKSKELVLYMPAPYLIDDAGMRNHDVEISLGGESGSYVLTYTLPQEWLADEARQWPVVLDPAVQPSLNILNIEDITLSSGGYLDYLDEYLHCGYHNSNELLELSRIFLKYTNLPELSAADVIVYAEARLNLIQRNYTSNQPEPIIEVHKVNGPWQSTTISWANNPGFSSTVEDFLYMSGSGYHYWTITDIVRGWYEDENTGMMFKMPEEAENAGNLNFIFTSSDNTDYIVAERPCLTMIFRNNNGLESYWDYTASSAGRAGTGYVNQYTGNLVWVRNDIGFGGNRMPVSISHVYNANDNMQNTFGMGYGWRTNFNQRVYHWDDDHAYGNYYVWEDSDGTYHYFKYVSANTYRDEDGLELVLETDGSGNEKYSITDKYGNVSFFDTTGRLTKQSNNQQTPSSITITYTATGSNLISTITDGVGRKYVFTYDNNLLKKIAFTGKEANEITCVNFTYDANQNLKNITDKDGKVSAYTYGANHLLSSAQDIDGYKLSYMYTDTAAGKPNRIRTITEYDDTVRGTNLCFKYAHNQTKLIEFYGDPDAEETTWDIRVTQLIQFNNMGNTISVQDDEGRAQYAQYAINDPDTSEASTASTTTGNNENSKGNQLKLASKLQNTVGNQMIDTSFERSKPWTITSGAPDDVTQEIVSGTAYLGNKSLKITRTSAGVAAGVQHGRIYAFGGKVYTFSAYVKTGSGSAYLELADRNGVTYTSEVLGPNQDWTRLEVSYTCDLTFPAYMQLYPRIMTANAGTVYIDCVQAEVAATASRYNLVDDGDFWYSNEDAWSSVAGVTNLGGQPLVPQLMSNAYKMEGNPTATNRISQTVVVSGNENDAYVLGGWAKADSVPIRDDREFGLIATFMNGGNVVNKQIVRFNDNADSTIEWQYAAAPVVAKGAYDSILIEIAYDYNANTAYFDGIQLFKEEFGVKYKYDGNGNIESVTDLQKQETTYTYNSRNDLIVENLPNESVLTYVYDDWHNVIKATTDTGVVYEFTYDVYGNNTSVSITSEGVKLTSTAEYSADKNYLVSTTDAANNTTTYNYDSNTGVLVSVKYPNDTTDTQTEYEYDPDLFRLTKVTAKINDSTTLSASYEYSNDLLSKITTGSTTYNFTYGDFALRSNIEVGSQLLATYAYDPQDHNLTSLTYGNGDKVSYEYDKHGRLIGQSYTDTLNASEAEETVTYQYDNNGALAVVDDSGSGIKTSYFYDLTDRLMKYTEKANGLNHIVGYEYDLINNLSKLTEKINGTSITSSYGYDADNRVTSVSSDITSNGATKSVSETYTYDNYGRISGKWVNSSILEALFYRTPTATTTAGQVATQKYSGSGYLLTNNYTYDANGNITTVKTTTNKNGTSVEKTTNYTYDTANQLIREDNQAANKTWIWTYDNAGNITSRTEFAYTPDANPTGGTTVSYAYNNTNWGDLLTQVGANAITYDEIGNMRTYNGTTFTWKHGRELHTLTKNGVTWTNTYNADGIRTKRTNGSTTYQYVYNGSSLSQMTVGGNTLNFAYDASGSPMAVVYNGAVYYYITNLQGDVVAILDSNKNVVVEYTYDAWGRILTTSGSMATTLGVHNPLRYRGYVYDHEVGLYYLQSRYYDPQLGRFINADAFTSTSQGVLGNNMFAYCLNNPANRIDSAGGISLWYYLIVDHDMGFIHRMVQAHILETGGPNIKAELILTGLGRADVVDVSLGTVWEVKHSGMYPEVRILEALVQAVGYIGGEYEDILIVGLGESGRFEGVFCITCNGYNYEVSYNTPTDGVILYSVKETSNSQEAYAYAYEYVPKTVEQESLGVVAVPAGALGFGFGGGSFNGAVHSKYCYI